MVFQIRRIKTNWLYRKKLKILEKSFYKCREDYESHLREAQEKGSDELKKALAERDAVCLQDKLELKKYMSSHLLYKADLYNVPVPNVNDQEMWDQQFRDFYLILSAKGRAEVDSAILKKRNLRNAIWVSRISALTGLIGALIGLLALILKFK